MFATLGGVATSLGFIGDQFLTGLEFQWGIQMGDIGTFAVITGITVLFTFSLVLGVDKGIRRLSNFNMVLFFVLMVATLVVGPTFFILQTGTDALGGFVADLFAMSLSIDVASGGDDAGDEFLRQQCSPVVEYRWLGGAVHAGSYRPYPVARDDEQRE